MEWIGGLFVLSTEACRPHLLNRNDGSLIQQVAGRYVQQRLLADFWTLKYTRRIIGQDYVSPLNG